MGLFDWLKGTVTTAAAFTPLGAPLAVTALLGINKAQKAYESQAMQQVTADNARISAQFQKDSAAEKAVTDALRRTPDLTDMIIQDAQKNTLRRQQSMMGRSSAFLTGPGGTMANKSLLGGGYLQ